MMRNNVSFHQNSLINILVTVLILTGHQIIDNNVKNRTFKVWILLTDSNVVIFINLKKLNILSITMFALSVYQDPSKWKIELILFEISNIVSDRVVDLLIYKNHYVFVEKLLTFSGKHDSKLICRRCLRSYSS